MTGEEKEQEKREREEDTVRRSRTFDQQGLPTLEAGMAKIPPWGSRR